MLWLKQRGMTVLNLKRLFIKCFIVCNFEYKLICCWLLSVNRVNFQVDPPYEEIKPRSRWLSHDRILFSKDSNSFIGGRNLLVNLGEIFVLSSNGNEERVKETGEDLGGKIKSGSLDQSHKP